MARLDPTRPLESTVLFMDLTTILAVVFLHILQVAGDGLQSRQLPGLLLNLHVTNTNTHFTGASFLNNQISNFNFDVSPSTSDLPNVHITGVTISGVDLSAASGSTEIFALHKTFSPELAVPLSGSGVVNSGAITNVPLTQGSAATLEFVDDGVLNVDAVFDARVTLVTDGPATLPLQVKEVAVNVPTSWTISLL